MTYIVSLFAYINLEKYSLKKELIYFSLLYVVIFKIITYVVNPYHVNVNIIPKF